MYYISIIYKIFGGQRPKAPRILGFRGVFLNKSFLKGLNHLMETLNGLKVGFFSQ